MSKSWIVICRFKNILYCDWFRQKEPENAKSILDRGQIELLKFKLFKQFGKVSSL